MIHLLATVQGGGIPILAAAILAPALAAWALNPGGDE